MSIRVEHEVDLARAQLDGLFERKDHAGVLGVVVRLDAERSG